MKKLTMLLLLLLLATLLGACDKDTDKSVGKTVKVYYIDSKTSVLASESYSLIGTGKEDRIKEMIYMLQQKKPKNAIYSNVLPKKVKVSYTFDESTLLIDFSTDYSELSVVDEVLCRAAFVKTLSQISGVDCFQFSVDGQALQDSDGVIGPLTADDFVDSTEAETVVRAKLYFANKEGNALVECMTDIDYSGAESIEELVIQQLINGPTELGMYSTIPEGTVLLNITKADGICTVDFNENFLDKLPNVSEDVVIYSIVNTLIELPDSNINEVQFTINSKVQKTFWEDIDFDSTFDQNLGLIENPE